MTHPLRPAAAGLVTIVALSGCAASTPPTISAPAAPAATSDAPPTTVAVTKRTAERPITTAQMLNAPVPSLCGHGAGRLRNGKLPGVKSVTIQGIERATWKDRSFARWKGTDGHQYAALAIACNQGGVPWPARMVFYKAGPSVIRAIDVSSLLGDGRQWVNDLTAVRNGVEAKISGTSRGQDAACCGSIDAKVRYTVTRTGVTGKVLARYDEVPWARRALLAAADGDEAGIKRYFAPEARANARQIHGAFGLKSSDWNLKPTCDGNSGRRDCLFSAKAAPAASEIVMQRTGFATWKAIAISLDSTD